MEENERPAFRPFANFGPGMQLWLLFSLFFACGGIYTLLTKSSSMAWLSLDPAMGYHVNFARLGQAFATILIFAIPAIVFTNVFPPERFRWFRLGVKVKPVLLFCGFMLMLVAMPALIGIYEMILSNIENPELIAYEEEMKSISAWINNMPGISDLLVRLFASALIPAIAEELFFRASLQQLLQSWTKKSHMAVWVTAIIFALFHQDIVSMPIIFLAGLFLGYAFYLTGSLRMTILMHFTFNASDLILNYIAQHNKTVADWHPSGLFIAGSLAVSFVFFGLLFRFGNAKN